MKGFVVIAGLAAVVAAAPLHAAESAPPDTLVVQEKEVVVTALRGRDRLADVPAATFVFSRDAIRASGASRVASLLQTLPGLYGYLQNASGDPSVVDPRGFTANGTSSYMKLLVNGHDVRDVENGNVDWDWMLTDDIERVEVVEGPGAWAYGDGSEGGIVNIVRPEFSSALRSDCAVRGGSFGLRTGSLMLSGQRGVTGAGARGSARVVDGWRDHSEERVYGGGFDARRQLGERTTLSFDLSGLDANREQPGTLSPAQIAADREQAETTTDFNHDRRLLLGLRAAHRDGGEGEWSAAPYWRAEDLDQVSTLFFDAKYHDAKSWAGGADLGWRRTVSLGGRPATFNIGSQIERAELRSQYNDYSGGVKGAQVANALSQRTTFSGYGGAQVMLDPYTTARLNVRGDLIRIESDDTFAATSVDARDLKALSPFVSLARRVGEAGNVYINFSTAFHTPTLAQLYDRRPFYNPFAMTNIFLSKPTLAPQRSVSTEVGARVDGPHDAYATVTVYSIHVRDEIDFDVATLSYANIGRSWHRGVQGGIQWPIVPQVVARANGTWSPTTIRGGGANDDNQINAVPIGTAYGGLVWTPIDLSSFFGRQAGEATSWSIEGGVRWIGRQYLDKANDHPLGEFTVADLVTVLRVGKAAASLRIANVFDRKYADTGFFSDLTGEERLNPAAGRSFQVALSLD